MAIEVEQVEVDQVAPVPTTTAPRLRPHNPEFDAKREALREQGVRYVLAVYSDIHGVAKAKCVPIAHFSQMMRGSELFTGAALDGLGQTPADDELAVIPDLESIMVMPHRPDFAFAPGTLYYAGAPYAMCSRAALERALKRAADLGFRFNLGVETEFFLVRRDGDGRVAPANPLDVRDKACYDVSDLLSAMPFLDRIVDAMNELGFDVRSFDHEDSNSQFEFDFGYADAMVTADRLVLWRVMMKEIAREHGFEFSLMPKPYSTRTGTGGHFNMSLADADSDENRFGDPADPRGAGLSELGYAFVAGILAHAPAITAVACPTVNSYKRLISTGSRTGSTWAPVFKSYGRNNRTHMLRLPSTSPRVENRAVDGSCNPYLAAAVMLQAGLDGVERGLDPGDSLPDNMYEMPRPERLAHGVHELPRTLLEAMEAFDADSEFIDRVFGPELREGYSEFKHAEWWDYHGTVSEWEVDRYLSFF